MLGPSLQEKGLNLGLLNLSTIDIWGQIFLGRGSCPVHGRMFSRILASIQERPAAPLSTPSPSCEDQKCLWTFQMSPGGLPPALPVLLDLWVTPTVCCLP